MTEDAESDPRQQIIDAKALALAGCPLARQAIDLLVDQGSFTEYLSLIHI